MKAAIMVGALGVVISLFLVDARPSHAVVAGVHLCGAGYVYEPSRNACVQ
jgi:hypothetical protein